MADDDIRWMSTGEAARRLGVTVRTLYRLIDESELPQLLRKIEARGDVWEWHLTGLTVLGIGIAPVFTEQMSFDEPDRIDYEHRPPGKSERAGADGWYVLEDHPDGTHLEIKLTMHVDLPLSRLAAPAVTRVMTSMMERTGERFATNLLHHLGAD